MAEETKPPVVLAPGSPAPHFSLPGGSGNTVSLADFAGKSIVLVYFYPKDDTPGCTKEACSLRDGWSALQTAGVVVLGISRDGAESHAAFASKYKLPFELLTDADHAVHVAYGAWGQNPNPIWGVGPLRKSFLIGKDGNILHVFDKVDTEHHADQVLKALGAPVAPAAMSNVGDAVKQVVEDVAQKPAVQKAAKAVKKVVADAKKKPAVKKAANAVKKVVTDVKAGVKKMKKAIAGARKKASPKKASKAARKPARKPARKVVKKAVRKAAVKPAPKKAKPAPKKAKPAPKKAKPAPKKAKPAPKKAKPTTKRKVVKGKGRR
jgi:peroxiredoxin Q/BCP